MEPMLQQHDHDDDNDRDDRPNQKQPPRRVAVKFVDDFDLPYEEGAEKYFSVDVAGLWGKLSAKFPEITLKPVYTSISPDRIKELVARAVQLDPTYQPPNFLTFFAIDTSSLRRARNLVKNLTSLKIVERAYVESLPSLAATTQPQHYVETPTETSQTARSSNDIGGIGVNYAWDLAGGDGNGVSFVDIEKGWCLDHPDLIDQTGQRKFAEPLGGSFNYGIKPDPFDYSETQHGTSVLGILATKLNPNDPRGWKGIAYGARGSVVSPWRGNPPNPPSDEITGKLKPPAAMLAPNSYQQPGEWNIANAVLVAIDCLSFGDVILLEVQAEDPIGSYWPIEIEPMNFEIIRLATALGIIVVEAAGNGIEKAGKGNNLKDKITRDSGAIIVGAANPILRNNIIPGSKRSTSNFGERVDCFAWGDTVFSLGIDAATGEPGAGNKIQYTRNFTGTSAATAIVAGAAIVLQGIVQKSLSPAGSSFRLSAFQMRNILRDRRSIDNVPINTPSADPAKDQIGVMPNLEGIVKNTLHIGPDVVIRDDLADNGDPHLRPVDESPDIIIRPTDETEDPQAEFGTSTSMEQSDLSSSIEAGKSYDIFVRVFNRGRIGAQAVQATVYWALPATHLYRPDLWNKVGTSNPATVPSGITSMQVLPSITWGNSDIPTHDSGINLFSFIATVGCESDPDPIPDLKQLISDLDPIPGQTPLIREQFYEQLFRLSNMRNNIAMRNVHRVTLPASTGPVEAGFTFSTANLPSDVLPLDFLAPGAYGDDLSMKLEVTAHLPPSSQFLLDGPTDFMSAMLNGNYVPGNQARMQLTLLPYGTTPFREFIFPARSENALRLYVYIPADQRQGSYDIYIKHLYENKEISRITWQLIPEIRTDNIPIGD